MEIGEVAQNMLKPRLRHASPRIGGRNFHTEIAMASKTPKPPKLTPSSKPRGKSELYRLIAEHTGLQRKQVAGVFETLSKVLATDLAKPSAGKDKAFVMPGLLKVVAKYKPATKATTKANPFKPGEMMEVKAKPAKTVLKIRPLKALKSMV